VSRLRLSAGLLALVVCLGIWIAGCGKDGESGPPAILYGADLCDHCRMVISEERHAGGARVGVADYRFDDPGCLVEFLGSEESTGSAMSWVHDEQARWLPVQDAWFVEDPNRGTPMGSGLMAFGSQEAALAAGERWGSEARRWADVGPVSSSPPE